MNDVVIAGAGPNGLMLACELALSGIRPVVVDPLAGPNPEPRANGVTGQGVRILDIAVSTASWRGPTNRRSRSRGPCLRL